MKNGNTHRVVELKFPVEIRQTGLHTVAIVVKEEALNVFSQVAVEMVTKTMGSNRGTALLDEMALDLFRQCTLDGVRASVINAKISDLSDRELQEIVDSAVEVPPPVGWDKV